MAKRTLKVKRVMRMALEMAEDAMAPITRLHREVTAPPHHDLVMQAERKIGWLTATLEQAVRQLRASDGPETQLTLKFG